MKSIPFSSVISFNHIKEFTMLIELKNIPINEFGQAIIYDINILDTYKSPMAKKIEDFEITLSGLRFMIDTGASITSIKKDLIDINNYQGRTTTEKRNTAMGLYDINCIHNFALNINGVCVKVEKIDLIDVVTDNYDGIIGWDILSHSSLKFDGYKKDHISKRIANLTIFKQ